MSKTKSKKYRGRAKNPTGIPSIRDFEKTYELPIGDFDSIVEKLKNPCAEERETGAVILANMANNKTYISDLLEKKVIRIAAPLLVDKCLSVRHAVTGSLKNIAVCGDHLVSEAMVEQDIMTSLVMLLEQYREPWSSVRPTDDKIDSKSEIFLEACNLLWTLCENSSTAISIFNNKNLIGILLPCLNVDVYDIRIPISVASCLQTVSENNPDVIDVLKQPVVEEQLRSLMTLIASGNEYLLLKNLAAGIKLNMYLSKLGDCMSDVTRPILEIVSMTLNEPLSPLLEDLSKKIASQKIGRLDRYHEETDLERELNAVLKAKEDLVHVLSAKQTSLEILGNIFEGGGSDDESDYVSCSETSDEVDMEIEECNISPAELGCTVSEDIYEIIIGNKIWDKVQEQIVMPSEEAEKNIGEHPHTKDCLKRLLTVRCTALLCLNNMLPKLEVEDIGGAAKLLELWLNIANLLFKNTDMTNTEQIEATTHCMHAVLQKLAESGFSSQFSSMTESDLELLLNVYLNTEDPKIKVHVIGSLGTIGKILCQVKQPSSALMIKKIGSFFIETCTKNLDLWILAETFDAIFDVFADDDVDFIAKELGLVENLNRARPYFEKKFKQQRKSLGDHADVIRTAKENLKHFIKYKLEYYKNK